MSFPKGFGSTKGSGRPPRPSGSTSTTASGGRGSTTTGDRLPPSVSVPSVAESQPPAAPARPPDRAGVSGGADGASLLGRMNSAASRFGMGGGGVGAFDSSGGGAHDGGTRRRGGAPAKVVLADGGDRANAKARAPRSLVRGRSLANLFAKSSAS